MCRKLKLIGTSVVGYKCVMSWCDLDLTFDRAVVNLETTRCRKFILARDVVRQLAAGITRVFLALTRGGVLWQASRVGAAPTLPYNST